MHELTSSSIDQDYWFKKEPFDTHPRKKVARSFRLGALNKHTKLRTLSYLLKQYPELYSFFTDSFNIEELILFHARVIRLESETEVYQKCKKGIYPMEWIYNFAPLSTNREFLLRYTLCWRRVSESTYAKIDELGVLELFEDAYYLVQYCANQLDEKQFHDPLIQEIHSQIQIIKRKDPIHGLFLFHLFGFIRRKEFLNQLPKNKTYYLERHGKLIMDFRNLVRYFDYLPICLAYMVKHSVPERWNEIQATIRKTKGENK